MAEGRSTPAERVGLRAAAPHQGGPLESSGAAPAGSVPQAEPVPAADQATPAVPSQREPSDKPGSGPDAAPPSADTPAANAEALATAKPADAAGGPPSALAGSAASTTPASTSVDDKTAVAGAGAKTATSHAAPRRRRNPVRSVGRGVGRAGRGTVAWAKRPSGRLILPAVVVLLLVGGAIAAGAYYVPEKLKASPTVSATPVFPGGAAAPVPSASLPGDLPSAGLPGGGGATLPATGTGVTQPPAAGTGQRPAEVLAGWAETTGTRVGIPVVAVEAYGYAELVLARTMPTCHLSWTTLAAIAEVESNHGHFQNSVLGADGTVTPPIYGLPLNGQGGRALIRDTDHGAIDGDPTYDRAVGPLQFIPATWLAFKVDADNSGVADPQNINDASLTAGIYLCQNGRDLSKPDDWYSAIYSYNAVQPYAEKVFQTANDYGQRSRA